MDEEVTIDANCLFCKIAAGQLPAKKIMETKDWIAIADINAQAPTHILIIPTVHVRNVTEFEDALALGRLFQAASEIAAKENLSQGFRLVVNTGADGGQTVDHLHIHVLGGRPLSWPPG